MAIDLSLITPFTSFYGEENLELLHYRYGDSRKLGEEWMAKDKLAERNKLLTDGRPNPQHPRLVIEAQQARICYDMSYIMQWKKQVAEQMEMMAELAMRMTILEGAYGHLKLQLGLTKEEYQASITRWVQERRAWKEEKQQLLAKLEGKSVETKQGKDDNHGKAITGAEG